VETSAEQEKALNRFAEAVVARSKDPSSLIHQEPSGEFVIEYGEVALPQPYPSGALMRELLHSPQA
jgi:hypothetical protein